MDSCDLRVTSMSRELSGACREWCGECSLSLSLRRSVEVSACQASPIGAGFFFFSQDAFSKNTFRKLLKFKPEEVFIQIHGNACGSPNLIKPSFKSDLAQLHYPVITRRAVVCWLMFAIGFSTAKSRTCLRNSPKVTRALLVIWLADYLRQWARTLTPAAQAASYDRQLRGPVNKACFSLGQNKNRLAYNQRAQFSLSRFSCEIPSAIWPALKASIFNVRFATFSSAELNFVNPWNSIDSSWA